MASIERELRQRLAGMRRSHSHTITAVRQDVQGFSGRKHVDVEPIKVH